MLQTCRLIPSPAASVATSTWAAPSRNCCSAWSLVVRHVILFGYGTWVTASNHRRITAPHTRTFNHGAALVPGSSREPGFMLPWMVATLNPPGFELLDEVVQRVLELAQEDQPLIRMVEESLTAQQLFELRELCLDTRPLDVLGLDGQRPQLRDSPPAPSRRSRASVMASSSRSSRSRSRSSISSSSSMLGSSGGAVRAEILGLGQPAFQGGRPDSRGCTGSPGRWRSDAAGRGLSGSRRRGARRSSPTGGRRGRSGASRNRVTCWYSSNSSPSILKSAVVGMRFLKILRASQRPPGPRSGK